MNVLVFDGPGVSKKSLAFSLSTLRTLLLPHYTVQTITPKALASEPWSANCALFVLPGGRDLPYVEALAKSNTIIDKYVREGGSFLGLCAGAYYACRRVEWEVGTHQEVTGSRSLSFFNGVGRGCTYPGFEYESEAGARATSILVLNSQTNLEDRYDGIYYNGGGDFVDAETTKDVTVLAKYTEEDATGRAAGVLCTVGKGVAILWGTHPEYPLSLEPALSAIKNNRPDLKDGVDGLEERRWALMRDTLRLLRLEVPAATHISQVHPLPQILVSSSIARPDIATMISNLRKDYVPSEPLMLKDTSDTFFFHTEVGTDNMVELMNGFRGAKPEEETRHILISRDDEFPLVNATPLFHISRYFQTLKTSNESEDERKGRVMGDVLLYGEVVTSTQTLLEKNPKLLAQLPIPILSLATHQIAGRGRGSNSWLSPPGCLQFSLLLRLSLASFPAARLVYIQYLFGLAVVEACRSSNVLGPFGDRVRLKWPNDIYALTESHGAPKKIGGILVNTSFMGGSVDVIIGCGLNVFSPSPLVSLAQLVPAGINNDDLSMEGTAATIMTTFDKMWSTFINAKGSFEPFNDLYLSRWLHSDQLVKVTSVDPPAMVRIVGITPEYGLLRTIPEGGGYMSFRGDNFIDLQPDGNSFDLMAGLIKAKT